MVHGFSKLTSRRKVRVSTGGGGLKNPRGGRRPRPRPAPDPSKGRGTIPPKGRVRVSTGGGGLKKPIPKRRKRAVDYVLARRARRGQDLTRHQARAIVRKNVRMDRKRTAYRHDFAGDGAGRKDKDYGTKKWRQYRMRKGLSTKKKKRPDDDKKPGGERKFHDSTYDPGNSQSGDSYGGRQSMGAGAKAKHLTSEQRRRRRRRRRRREH